jgi:hypothetical protein
MMMKKKQNFISKKSIKMRDNSIKIKLSKVNQAIGTAILVISQTFSPEMYATNATLASEINRCE